LNNLLYLMLITGFFAPLYLFAQTRDIVMLHDFGSGNNGWDAYEFLFESERDIHAHRFLYNNQDGVANAATDAHTNMITNSVPQSQNNIGIGHSTGGTVFRKLDEQGMDEHFGGIITACTGHHGLQFANAYTNGEVEDFFDEGCHQVLTQPVFTMVSLLGPSFSVFTPIIQSLGGNLVCSFAYQSLQNEMSDFLSPNTIGDMSVGSTELANINSFPSTKHIVTLWGNEQSPVHWRFLSSLQPANRPVNINPVPSLYIDRDVQFVNTMNTLHGVETTMGIISHSYGLLHLLFWNFYQAGNWFYIRDQWMQGADWIENSESGWNELTGSNGWVTLPVEVDDVFVCNAEMLELLRDWKDDIITFEQFEAATEALLNDPNCYETGTIMSAFPVNGESDGLVNSLTARVTANTCHLKVENANHQELVNHPSAYDAFEVIFKKEDCVHPFFETD
ncbi:MAG: hypothetical protein KC425_27930, partial [Anaerolineales bacterium]|nr:hypothetical protein [Anaerolineales bacterium]